MTAEMDRRIDQPERPDSWPLTPPEPALEASGPTLRLLFEEAGNELARIATPPAAAGPACRWQAVSLQATDLSELAGLWLDRLLALGEARLGDRRREAVVAVAVDRVTSPAEDPIAGRWRLRARVGLRPYRDVEDRGRSVRSASDRPLAVERSGAAWRLHASLAS